MWCRYALLRPIERSVRFRRAERLRSRSPPASQEAEAQTTNANRSFPSDKPGWRGAEIHRLQYDAGDTRELCTNFPPGRICKEVGRGEGQGYFACHAGDVGSNPTWYAGPQKFERGGLPVAQLAQSTLMFPDRLFPSSKFGWITAWLIRRWKGGEEDGETERVEADVFGADARRSGGAARGCKARAAAKRPDVPALGRYLLREG